MDMFKEERPKKAKKSFLYFSPEEIVKMETFLATTSRVAMADRLQRIAKLYCANKYFRDSMTRLIDKHRAQINRYIRPEKEK